MGPTLKEDYPQVAGMARVSNTAFVFANGDAKFKIIAGRIDPDFLTMFDFPLLYGNKEIALDDPYSVILTEKVATRIFGNEDPMGKTLLANNQLPVTVTGVMKNLPSNTEFDFEALVPVALAKALGRWHDEGWYSMSVQTYVELHPNAQLASVNESIRGIVQAHTDDQQAEVFLYPLNRQHIYSRFENGVPVGGLVDMLRIAGIIAGLLLLIACINFINLSTARSQKRAKEVGVRKVMGGKRISLIFQFLGESTVVVFIAGAVALIFVLMILPRFIAFINPLMEKRLTFNFVDIRFWVVILGFILLTDLLAGSYPAFYLSSFKPVKVLKGIVRTKKRGISSRKILVVVQFTIACALIMSTLVIHRQIRYALNRSPGFNKDNLIYISLEGDINKNYELIKQDLLNTGTAISITKTLSPMDAENRTWGVNWQGKDPNTRLTFDVFGTDADLEKTIGVTIIEGRDIDVYTYPTDSTAMILNEAAVKIMNFENPMGEIVSFNGIDWHIAGVVKDFIFGSPNDLIHPMIILGPAGWFTYMHVKLNSYNTMADNLAQVEKVFKQYNPDFPVEYGFVDEDYAIYKLMMEQQIGKLITWVAGFAIFITCLGLFALVAYMAETRKKEIGIRKVLGASVSSIVILLSKEFLILVIISFAIASPIAWLAMNQWLAGYAYRTNIPWWLFVVVGCMSLCITLLTVGFQALKAATTNPVDAIKSE